MTSSQLVSCSTFKAENFFSKIKNKTRMPILTTFIQYSSGTPSHSNHTRNRIKDIQIGRKKVKKSLFSGNVYYM